MNHILRNISTTPGVLLWQPMAFINFIGLKRMVTFVSTTVSTNYKTTVVQRVMESWPTHFVHRFNKFKDTVAIFGKQHHKHWSAL